MEKTSNQFASTLKKGIDQVKKMLETGDDILSVLKEDHKPLKELIQTMKDAGKSVPERLQAFQEFAPLLITHATAEEKSLYEFMKTKAELREYAFEGDTEHSVADQLTEETKRVSGTDELGAKIKVLAELVEHHIKEEENTIFPAVKKAASEQELKDLTKTYAAVQEEIISEGQDNAPREAELTRSDVTH